VSIPCHYGDDLGTLSAIYLYVMSMFPALNAINNGGDEKIPIARVLGRRRLYVGENVEPFGSIGRIIGPVLNIAFFQTNQTT